ncbi:MAG: SDR family oxidoreductase [Gammaproteobacteria bacterium]|nr:SDR family oxidoreductase [Gammaproteobacteria bacterium]MCP5135953.1 SDR family oxidoreductase [Gammaproteobacteria bacterium]
MQRILIFGATSAIAAACARRWNALGAQLFLVARDQTRLATLREDLTVRGGPRATIETATADLADLSTHIGLFDAAERALGGLDIVLIAHGTLPDQTACEASIDTTLEAIQVNALSYVSLLTEAANRFERKGNGVIAAISSVAGDRGRKSNYVYGAAKGMVSLFMGGLRNRLAGKDVAVVNIKPGFVDTPMTAAFEKGALWAKPDTIAKGIVKAIARRRDDVYLPGFWGLIMFVIRHIPERLFKRLSL